MAEDISNITLAIVSSLELVSLSIRFNSVTHLKPMPLIPLQAAPSCVSACSLLWHFLSTVLFEQHLIEKERRSSFALFRDNSRENIYINAMFSYYLFKTFQHDLRRAVLFWVTVANGLRKTKFFLHNCLSY